MRIFVSYVVRGCVVSIYKSVVLIIIYVNKYMTIVDSFLTTKYYLFHGNRIVAKTAWFERQRGTSLSGNIEVWNSRAGRNFAADRYKSPKCVQCGKEPYCHGIDCLGHG